MLIVQKYGGTSVGSPERIAVVAARVARTRQQGHEVVVVVSAMAGETNRLVALGESISDDPPSHLRDLLLATGEQAAVALTCMALEKTGAPALPLLGHQARIITDDAHGRARIQHIEVDRIRAALADGKTPVIAGFQGVTDDGAITTIGRGGSDTSAVAVAAALKADLCEINTDVAGVYTADPRICNDARLLPCLSFEEMLELADAGAKVLHSRSVEIAARYRVPLVVRSSFDDGAGTRIVPEEEIMESTLVSGITADVNDAKVAIRRVPDKVGIPAHIFAPLAEAGINVDMILQNVSQDGLTDLTFTVPKQDLKRAMQLAESAAREVGAGQVEAAGDIAKISVIGVGMRTHAGVAHKMFAALAHEGIGIQMISTSEIKVAIVIDLKYAELAVRTLHQAFELGTSPRTQV